MEINFDSPDTVYLAVSKIRNTNSDSGFAYLLEGCLFVRQENFSEAINRLKKFFKSKDVSNANMQLFFAVLSSNSDLAGLKRILDTFRAQILDRLFHRETINIIPKLLDDLKFSKLSSKKYQSLIGRRLVSHMINRAYEAELLELAFYLENRYYAEYISRLETEEAFGHGMSAIKDAASNAGRRFFQSSELGVPKLGEQKVVGFFVHSASMLAHISNIFQFLSACAVSKDVDFTPIIFCLSGRNKEFHEAFSSINVKIIYLDTDNNGSQINSVSGRLLHLKNLCDEFKVTHFVWVCLAVYMSFSFSLKLAGQQIWWSQKWQKLTLPSIQKYIFSHGLIPKERFNGVTWRNSWFQHKKWVAETKPDEIRRLRQTFQGKVVLGTLAREDKLTEKRYLRAVSSVLKAHPDTVFLWTGRQRLKEIDEYFCEENVIQQTQFIGWVDTNVYAGVYDILLDTFPIGNGLTATQAMELGTPVVLHKSNHEFRTMDLILGAMRSTERLNTDLIIQLQEIFNFSSQGDDSLYTCASHSDEYVDLCSKLIMDLEFRQKVGCAYQKFVLQFMSDPLSSAKSFATHILE